MPVLRRCLEKKPEKRFQSARDLAFALETSFASTGSAVPAAGVAERRPAAVGKWFALAAAVAGAAIAGYLLHGGRAAEPELDLSHATITPLTTDPGYEGEPTFFPDGQTIAYVADRDGNFEIYLQQISGGPAKPKAGFGDPIHQYKNDKTGNATYALWENFLACVKDKKRETLSTPELGSAAFSTVAMGVQSFRQGKVLFWDKDNKKAVEADASWASNLEKRSKERGKPTQILGWKGGTKGSTVVPPAYQKLEGPWTDGKDPAADAAASGGDAGTQKWGRSVQVEPALTQIGSASAIIDARCNSACSCAGARCISSSPSRTEFSTTMRHRS